VRHRTTITSKIEVENDLPRRSVGNDQGNDRSQIKKISVLCGF
jgi:hypothetical protein